MDKLEPGFYAVSMEHDEDKGWHTAYTHIAGFRDTVRVVMADGTFIDVTCKEGLAMVRCTEGALVVHPDTANQIGIGQSTFYTTLGRTEPVDDKEEVDCPEGEARFFRCVPPVEEAVKEALAADDMLHDARHIPTDHE